MNVQITCSVAQVTVEKINHMPFSKLLWSTSQSFRRSGVNQPAKIEVLDDTLAHDEEKRRLGHLVYVPHLGTLTCTDSPHPHHTSSSSLCRSRKSFAAAQTALIEQHAFPALLAQRGEVRRGNCCRVNSIFSFAPLLDRSR